MLPTKASMPFSCLTFETHLGDGSSPVKFLKPDCFRENNKPPFPHPTSNISAFCFFMYLEISFVVLFNLSLS